MSIQDLPTELIIEILAVLPLPSLLALTCTSKCFASICQDPVIWKQRLQNDFNFSPTPEAVQAAGFKRFYRAIRSPKVFVFGSSELGRLGLTKMALRPHRGSGYIPYPLQATVNARVVSIATGRSSCHALDDLGNLHVWGQLDGTRRSNDFRQSSGRATLAHRLDLPGKMISISCSRAHAVSLDTNHQVWIFTSWGHPCLLRHPAVKSDGDPHTVVQVEAGWSFVSVLTKSGSVYAIWPFEGDFLLENRIRNTELDESQQGTVHVNHNTISCIPIEMGVEPLLLPEIPDNLPALRDEYQYSLPRLIKIAAGDGFLIGLTDQGHVLSINLANSAGGGPTPQWLQGAFIVKARQWTYLPHFSDINDIRKDPAYSDSKVDSTTGPHIQAPKWLCVTQIAARGNSFAVLAPSSGLVLLGRKRTNEVLRLSRTVIAALQNRGIAHITLGDHHSGAVTSEGTLLTWGAFAEGALGLGDPRELDYGAPGGYAMPKCRLTCRDLSMWLGDPLPAPLPAEVRFEKHERSLRQPYCIAAAAGGDHTAALVIDLDGSDHSPGLSNTALTPPIPTAATPAPAPAQADPVPPVVLDPVPPVVLDSVPPVVLDPVPPVVPGPSSASPPSFSPSAGGSDAGGVDQRDEAPGRNIFARAIASALSLMLCNRGRQY